MILSKCRLLKDNVEKTRENFNIIGLVEIHHVVPKEFKNHPTLLREKYDVEEDYNFVFVPSKKGMYELNSHNRPIHSGGHPAYNLFVKTHLDKCNSSCYFLALLCILFNGSRGRIKVPWK